MKDKLNHQERIMGKGKASRKQAVEASKEQVIKALKTQGQSLIDNMKKQNQKLQREIDRFNSDMKLMRFLFRRKS